MQDKKVEFNYSMFREDRDEHGNITFDEQKKREARLKQNCPEKKVQLAEKHEIRELIKKGGTYVNWKGEAVDIKQIGRQTFEKSKGSKQKNKKDF